MRDRARAGALAASCAPAITLRCRSCLLACTAERSVWAMGLAKSRCRRRFQPRCVWLNVASEACLRRLSELHAQRRANAPRKAPLRPLPSPSRVARRDGCAHLDVFVLSRSRWSASCVARSSPSSPLSLAKCLAWATIKMASLAHRLQVRAGQALRGAACERKSAPLACISSSVPPISTLAKLRFLRSRTCESAQASAQH